MVRSTEGACRRPLERVEQLDLLVELLGRALGDAPDPAALLSVAHALPCESLLHLGYLTLGSQHGHHPGARMSVIHNAADNPVRVPLTSRANSSLSCCTWPHGDEHRTTTVRPSVGARRRQAGRRGSGRGQPPGRPSGLRSRSASGRQWCRLLQPPARSWPQIPYGRFQRECNAPPPRSVHQSPIGGLPEHPTAANGAARAVMAHLRGRSRRLPRGGHGAAGVAGDRGRRPASPARPGTGGRSRHRAAHSSRGVCCDQRCLFSSPRCRPCPAGSGWLLRRGGQGHLRSPPTPGRSAGATRQARPGPRRCAADRTPAGQPRRATAGNAGAHPHRLRSP
ncbi:hypothetical protein SAMN05216574_10777 [Blastococcus tunisiensis]|uniref:Uncharacterized protein n=1 Tax=Blastococcus tunisiensis TaxID=1798228 RepID=A0A1I2EIT5_9ACTN|nr:hypothetical protein SAMN05216574_10777 [Blastococcus sp. DSM 46838]